MNAARLKLGGTVRNVHLTPQHQWNCPIQSNPSLSSGLFHNSWGIPLSHSNSHVARNTSSASTNANCKLETFTNCHLMHHAKASIVKSHLIQNARASIVKSPLIQNAKASDVSCHLETTMDINLIHCTKINTGNSHNTHCIEHRNRHLNSQTSLLCNSSFLFSGQRDHLVVQSPVMTSFRHLSMLSRTPFLKGHCLHTVHSRSLFEGFYTSLSQSAPVQSTQGLLLELHQWSGLPWWAVIALSTLTIRTFVVLPLAIHQLQVIWRLARIDAELRGLAPELNKEVAIARRMYGFDEVHARRVFKKQLRSIRHKFILRDNCHPFKSVLLVFFQMPLWVCLSVSLRNITFMAQTGGGSGSLDLKSEGLLWFPDLTAPDPIVIPLVVLALNLTLTHIHVLRQKGKSNTLQKVLLNGSRVISVVVAAAATINPTSVSFYWVCSSAFGLGQNLLLASPSVKRILGIPSPTTSKATPVREADNNQRQTQAPKNS